MKDIGIILEGGAMRSIFSAGVLDFFLDNDIHVPNVIAVSAGAYAGMNYVSEQRGRVMDAIIKPLEKEKYLGVRTFLKKGTFFDMYLLFDEIPKRKAPFDFDKFTMSAKRFVISTVNCLTGEPVYHDTFQDEDGFLKICRAANSLPFISKITNINGIPMLDGGMADPIPIERALEENWNKMIIVVTRNSSYKKKQSFLYITMIKLLYRKYPKFVDLVVGRAERYNDSLHIIEQLEKEGKAFVLRPTGDINLTNNEADTKKLRNYYKHGYEVAASRNQELQEFLNQRQ